VSLGRVRLWQTDWGLLGSWGKLVIEDSMQPSPEWIAGCSPTSFFFWWWELNSIPLRVHPQPTSSFFPLKSIFPCWEYSSSGNVPAL
jgi:hypothetical protein